MGQFRGFSDDHSSLVVNVRNLRISDVSPQFHVFNDIFQTVFNLDDNDMVADAIWNQLFKYNWNICAENEFSVDGALIYSPPSLDEVWLSESEPQDRKEKVHAQCCQHEEHQCIQVYNTP